MASKYWQSRISQHLQIGIEFYITLSMRYIYLIILTGISLKLRGVQLQLVTVQSQGQMIPVRNAIGAAARNFVVNLS
jgi:hypothetical protein